MLLKRLVTCLCHGYFYCHYLTCLVISPCVRCSLDRFITLVVVVDTVLMECEHNREVEE